MRKTKKQRALELEQCLYRAEQGIHAMFRLIAWNCPEEKEKADSIRENIIKNMDLIKAFARIHAGTLSKEMIDWDAIDAFLLAQNTELKR